MKPAHYTTTGHRLIILNKCDRPDLLFELALREGFEKVATRIAEHSGLENQQAFDSRRDNVHAKDYLDRAMTKVVIDINELTSENHTEVLDEIKALRASVLRLST